MKPYPLSLSVAALLTIVLSACIPGAAPLPTEPVTEPPDIPPPEALVVTEPPSLAPVSFAGPPMEVGSMFLYVDGSTLVAVPAGEFIMGHNGKDNPQHTVYLDDLLIYRSAVTNQQYAFCVAEGQCSRPDPNDNPVFNDPKRRNDPVVGVKWNQAEAYCEFVHGRLPTEAEWEKTARGPNGDMYPWGNSPPSCDLLNIAYCVGKTTDVTRYPQGQSYYEALDMSGNVNEWVADWYSPTYYSIAPVENPSGPQSGEKRSVRSSGFMADYINAESARRWSLYPSAHQNDLGFRCVIEDPLYFAPFCETVGVYGFGPGGAGVGVDSYTVSCDPPTFSAVTYCVPGDQPKANVTIINADPLTSITTVDSDPSCGGGLPTFTACDPGAVIHVCAECDVVLPSDATPACPPPYSYDAGSGSCKADGWPGNCLPGFNYDPTNQCCAAGPGTPGFTPPCPSGTVYLSDLNICLQWAAADPGCADFTAPSRDCEHEGGYSSLMDSSPLIRALEEEQAKPPITPVSRILMMTVIGLVGWVTIYGRKRS